MTYDRSKRAWRLAKTAIEMNLERIYDRLDEILADEEVTDAEAVEYLRSEWGSDIADGYAEWIKEGEE